jgi:hypothetical protein
VCGICGLTATGSDTVAAVLNVCGEVNTRVFELDISVTFHKKKQIRNGLSLGYWNITSKFLVVNSFILKFLVLFSGIITLKLSTLIVFSAVTDELSSKNGFIVR